MTDYTPIITRLQAATGADRELDVLIGHAIDLKVDGDVGIRHSVTIYGLERVAQKASSYQNIWYTSLPQYTASIDAALALVEEKLGGHIGPISLLIAGSAMATIESNHPCGWGFQVVGSTTPIAILLALFQVLQEKENGN